MLTTRRRLTNLDQIGLFADVMASKLFNVAKCCTMRMCQVAVAHAGAIQPLVQLLRDEAHLG